MKQFCHLQSNSYKSETNSLNLVKGEDLDSGPSGYVYVRKNGITNPLPIERNIAN